METSNGSQGKIVNGGGQNGSTDKKQSQNKSF